MDNPLHPPENSFRLVSKDIVPIVIGQGLLQVYRRGEWRFVCGIQDSSGNWPSIPRLDELCIKLGFNGISNYQKIKVGYLDCLNVHGSNICPKNSEDFLLTALSPDVPQTQVFNDLGCSIFDTLVLDCVGSIQQDKFLPNTSTRVP